MKKLIVALLSLTLIAWGDDLDPDSVPPFLNDDPEEMPAMIPMPPLPPGATATRQAVVPALPIVVKTSITSTNHPIFKLTVKYDAQVYGFGLAYSDDLVNWIQSGESQWTNATPSNPFAEPGTTEHRVWIGEPQWQVLHRPDAPTNRWTIVLTDHTAKKSGRFYKIYPLKSVTGLPYP